MVDKNIEKDIFRFKGATKDFVFLVNVQKGKVRLKNLLALLNPILS